MSNNMNKAFYELIGDVMSERPHEEVEKCYTHIITCPVESKIIIPPQNINDFWISYCDMVESNSRVHLAERSDSLTTLPVVLDLTFRFDVADSTYEIDDIINDKFLMLLVSCIQQTILDHFIVDNQRSQLICCVLLSSQTWVQSHNNSKYLCKGVKLHFPYCRLETTCINNLLYPKCIDTFRRKNVIGSLKHQPVDDWHKIIAMDLYNRPLLMYGSTSRSDEPPRLINFVWGAVTKEHVDGVVELEDQAFETMFKLSNHVDFSSGVIDVDYFTERDFVYWAPFCFSVGYWSSITMVKPRAVVAPVGKINQISNSINNVSGDMTDEQLCDVFLNIINPQRFEKKIYWLDLGRALYNSYKDRDEGFNKWVEITERLENKELDRDLCLDHYAAFGTSSITWKTLAWYAKEDNVAAFNKWHEAWIKEALDSSLTLSHTDVGEALRREFFLQFTYATFKTKSGGRWYQFKGQTWILSDQGIELKKLISSVFVKRYEKLRVDYSQQCIRTTDESMKMRFEGNIKKITNLIGQLKDQRYKGHLIREAAEKFHILNFTNDLDDNLYLIAHADCVSEVDGDKIVFRPGKPEDFITNSTHVAMKRDLSWDHPKVKEFMRWINQLFTDEELRRCFLKYLASWLLGGNVDKKIFAFTGETGGSKSMVIKAFECSFGDYFGKLSTSASTSKMRANQCSPEIAQGRGKRGLVQDEFEEDDIQQSGFLKRMSGGDSFFARMLFDDGGKIKMSFKLLQVFNNVPLMNSVHESIKQRFILFPFISQWVDDAPDSEEEQFKQKKFKKDPLFDSKIPGMAPAILWVAAQWYPIYRKEGIHLPKLVKEMISEYWKDVDIYDQFKQELIVDAYVEHNGVKVRDTCRLEIAAVYREFKAWFENLYKNSNQKCPTLREFKINTPKYVGKLAENKYWVGIKLATHEPISVGH